MHTNPEVLALLALGEQSAATQHDREHIAGCDSCRAEVDQLAHLAGVGRSVDDHVRIEAPSPQVWERIRTELGFTGTDTELRSQVSDDDDTGSAGLASRSGASHNGASHNGETLNGEPLNGLAEPVPVTDLDTARTARRAAAGSPLGRRVLALAVAAALALVVGIGVGVAWERRGPAEAVVAQVPLEPLPNWAGAGGEATLEVDREGNRVLVITVENPRPVGGFQQVWLLDRTAQGMVNVGLLSKPMERFALPANLDVSRFPIVDVSDEPGDGDVRHSGNSIVRAARPLTV